MTVSDAKSYNDILQMVKDGQVHVSRNWLQGRAGYGGLMAAIAAEHMYKSQDDSRPIRSFMGTFVAPAPADILTVETTSLRQGRNVSQLSTSITSPDGQVCFQAMGAFGTARETEANIDHHFPMQAEDRNSLPPMPKRPLEPADSLPPVFLNNFQVHWTGGGFPMSGKKDRRVGMWVKHENPVKSTAAAAMLAIGDIAPAAVMSHYTKPIRISSLTWSVEFVEPADQIDGSGWFYLDYRADAAAGGYSQQSGTIHSEDGTLIALSRQCMCYFD